ncbi:ester cyclase [Pseudonocardia acaciae]|uniref:ester cyclase n=1 Tax=Pseudonocardia acaciae TaxID=551276 RepID=UPI000562E9CC|nr:ester cyclase [Pseudonocardia acaciae]
MSTEANKTLVREMIEQVWNAGSIERLPEFWVDDTRPEAEGLHSMLTGAFPDLRITIDDLIAEADRVVARLSFAGTHLGAFRDIPPTGRPVRFGAIRIYRIAGGKVAETWAHQDSLGLLGQLRS